MKRILLLIILLICNNAIYTMENPNPEKQNVTKQKRNLDEDNPGRSKVREEQSRSQRPEIQYENLEQNINEKELTDDEKLIEQHGAFYILPLELIEYILAFLFDEPLQKSQNSVEKLENILVDKNLANLRLVNRHFHRYIVDLIHKKLNSILKTYPNEKEIFENKFFDIADKMDKQLTKNDLQIFKWLLKSKINLNIRKNDDDLTVFLMAADRGIPQIIELILNHIQNLPQETQMEIINFSDSEANYTALIMAADSRYTDILNLILNHIKNLDKDKQIAIINAKTNTGRNALLAAISDQFNNNKIKSRIIVETILKYIKNFSQNQQIDIISGPCSYEYGNSSITLAVDECKKILKLILKHIKSFDEDAQVAIINAKNDDGETALILAARRTFASEISYDGKARSILKHIKHFKEENQIKILNAQDLNGNSPLIHAVLREYTETVELIILYIYKRLNKENRLKILNLKNNDGKTALDIAREKNYARITRILQSQE